VRAIPEVIEGQELDLFRVFLAGCPADIGGHMDGEPAVAHRQSPHLQTEADVAGLLRI